MLWRGSVADMEPGLVVPWSGCRVQHLGLGCMSMWACGPLLEMLCNSMENGAISSMSNI